MEVRCRGAEINHPTKKSATSGYHLGCKTEGADEG